MSELTKPMNPKRPLSPNEITPIGPDDPARFLNRDIQWLEFNRRVLAQATDPRNPLLERVRFLAIFGSNLDEFFMKRVGGLRRQIDAGVGSSAISVVGTAINSTVRISARRRPRRSP